MEDENIENNEKEELYDINPYLDALQFFINDESINEKFINIYNNSGISNGYVQQFIKDIIIPNIIINKGDTEQINQQKLIFAKKPEKIFNFLLNELHKICREKEIFEPKIKSAEINKENAENLFKQFIEKDKSYISEKFYGIKSIEKTCKECKMSHYIYKYLKTIPIKIKDINKENEIDFEKCIKKLQTKFELQGFCPICSSQKNLSIKIKIEKFPKTAIFIFYGNEKYIHFKIKNSIKKGGYELIATEIKYKKNNILDYFTFCFKNNNYEFIPLTPVDDNFFENKIPLVLFYQKRGQMLTDVEIRSDSKDSFCSSSKPTENSQIISHDGVEINKILQKPKNLIEKKEIKETKEIKGKIKITLYFKIEKTEKELTINTYNSENFYKIINELKTKINKESDNNDDIDINKIFFNKRKIDMKKCPTDYNMTDGSHIIIDG